MPDTHLKILTVSGLPGSGTSTACGLLREQLGWNYVNAGQIFRDLAHRANASLAEMGRRAESDPQIDRDLDARMVQVARSEPPIILEGRMTGWMALRAELSALKVWLDAPAALRAERVGVRDGDDQALQQMLDRQHSEAQRYRVHHGIDIGDCSIYDAVIDTAVHDPEAVVAQVMCRLENR